MKSYWYWVALMIIVSSYTIGLKTSSNDVNTTVAYNLGKASCLLNK